MTPRGSHTNNSPIPRTRNPQRLALHLPPTVQTQRRQPDTIHRIRALLTPLPSQVQPLLELFLRDRDRERRRGRALEPDVERPRAARDREVPRRAAQRREHGHPRRELVRVVPDDEHPAREVRLHSGVATGVGGGVEGVDVQRRLGGGGVVGP
jgi:hypothetical protein